ncbi:glycosyl transferase family 2 [Paenibacillus elgii]|uniref:Glycosyl transferase family 2 n=1 Tax=Paenibacillus elgii TaxID=189691 RepID=A0A2T6FVA1_9BACL|nr:glycosyltransferase family 2 protein [Paenibacillus elgii]PUA35823.1 glycosyl transferase family 2 [Paenibacillus elgii]
MRPVRKTENNRLTAMMQVRNEENRFLEEVLQDVSEYADDIVIVDDASTDRTADICLSFPKVKEVVRLTERHFSREWELRSLLWRETCKYGPDWVLAIDADEVFESKFKRTVRQLMDQDSYDWVGFRMYDFWGGRTHYREDEHWQLHKRHTIMLLRNLPGFPYYYLQHDHHVHRVPLSYGALPGLLSDIRVKHLGWAGSEEERRRKYERYKQMDPEGVWGSQAQYESILDAAPRLVEWKEEES